MKKFKYITDDIWKEICAEYDNVKLDEKNRESFEDWEHVKRYYKIVLQHSHTEEELENIPPKELREIADWNILYPEIFIAYVVLIGEVNREVDWELIKERFNSGYYPFEVEEIAKSLHPKPHELVRADKTIVDIEEELKKLFN